MVDIKGENKGINKLIDYKNRKIQPKDRIWEIDFLRGLFILLVVMDHFFIDTIILGISLPPTLKWLGRYYYFHTLRAIIRPAVVASFMIMCGISSSFSRNNLVRGGKLLAIALLLTLFTFLADVIMGVKNNLVITNGILHCLAYSIIIGSLLELIPNKKIANKIIFVVAIASIIAGLYCKRYYDLYYNTSGLYNSAYNSEHILFDNKLWGFIFYSAKNVYTSDYFALTPGLGFFLMGMLVGKLIYKDKKTLLPDTNLKPINWLCYCGRHTLWFYFIGQVVAVGILFLVSIFYNM